MVKLLMVQGTSSNAGKSSLVAALCRIFSDDGYKVAPLKAQNMSSNLYITKEGLEMAKAQAIQAIAARTEPSVYMNPILLKPMGDYVSRVVLMGKMYRDMHAKYYYSRFVMKQGVKYVKQAFRKLASKYDIIVIEGAGSPAEINLADYDLANMKLAEMVNAPVVIVADIDRGGCFASMVGTLQLLKQKHRSLVKGFVINKFRGDKSILDSAIDSFEHMTKKPVLGIVPFVDNMLLPNEDSLGTPLGKAKGNMINVAVIRYPDAINLSDFDSLLQVSDALNAYYVTATNKLEDADLILLPSSRDIVSDLNWLHESKIGDRIKALHAKGKPVIGICEGFAMMGNRINFDSSKFDGLGLLDTTVYADRKISGNIKARVASSKGMVTSDGMMEAYLREDYRVVNGKNATPLLQIMSFRGKSRRFAEGSVSKDGLALGCSIYGLFDAPNFRNRIIDFLSRRKGINATTRELDAIEFWDEQIQKFSDTVKDNIDMHEIRKMVGLN
jgi:adenosylcobyric acid synthase